jgi:CRP-like cAMP-binding protein/Fe-S-cluster-containing hydrogenase component 2
MPNASVPPAPPSSPKGRDPRFDAMGFASVKLFATLQKDASVTALMNGHQFAIVESGSVLVSQGEYTGKLFVVLEGLLGVYRTQPDGQILKFETLKPGDWFGEASALSNQPAMATVEAEMRCVLVALDAATFKALYRGEKGFESLVDGRYRERSLTAHLRVVPLFHGLPEKTLREIQKRVEFLVQKEKTVVAKEGDPADAIYLVRSGAVKCTTTDASGAERVLGYFMDNSSFGERSLASGAPSWPGTFETMARTEFVKVPRAVLDETLEAASRARLATSADLIVQQETVGVPGAFDLLQQATTGELSRDRLEIMVAKQSVKGGHALVIDLTKCVRCNACVESCVAVHADRVPRLSKTGNRISSQKTLASACYHCEIPECMMACNYGAIRRDLRGSIEFIWDNCVGCTSCVSKCPYGVIRMTQPLEASPYASEVSRLAGLPLIGHWFRSKACSTPGPAGTAAPAREEGAPIKQFNRLTGREETVAGKAIKCDLCAGMPFEACVYNCPCSAILRVVPEALFEDES